MSPFKINSLVTIAVIGTGLIGPRHAEAVHQEPGAELFCVVDPNPAAEQVARRFGVEWYASIQDMLKGKGKPEGAIVCTPNHTHVSVSMELLDAGIHVVCEKPIATDSSMGEQLVCRAEERKLQLLIGHHRRFNRYVVATKRILNERKLGKVIAVSGLWTTFKPLDYFDAPSEWRRGCEGGPILINLIHEVDVLQHLLGPIIRVHAENTASERGFEAEEGCAMTLRFQSGVVGTFVLSDATPSPHNFESGTGENPLMPTTGQDVYRIMGSEGTLSVPDMRLWSYSGAKTKSWLEELDMSIPDVPETQAPFELQVKHFVEVVRGNEQPVCSGNDGLRAVVVCEAVKKSLQSGLPVDIPGTKSF